jgi:hypothetical protein
MQSHPKPSSLVATFAFVHPVGMVLYRLPVANLRFAQLAAERWSFPFLFLFKWKLLGSCTCAPAAKVSQSERFLVPESSEAQG